MTEEKTAACTGDCEQCGLSGTGGCPSDRAAGAPEPPATAELNDVKHVIAVMSGKGGVGKSTVAALLAAGLARQGHAVGLLDADITGPSIPKLFGVDRRPEDMGFGLIPPESDLGIRIMSVNLLIEKEDDPLIWRAPLINALIQRFWAQVVWGNLDYLVVDLPPGTADAPLTVLQSLPVDGVVIVSSPQDLVKMVVRKAVKMVTKLGLPLLGLVENMSFITCPKCKEKIYPFGEGRAEEASREMGLPLLGTLPLDPELVRAADRGEIEEYAGLLQESIDRIIAGVTAKLPV